MKHFFHKQAGVAGRKAGFTLVEILVVLAIITLLAAILFPVFKRARESGNQTNCAANLHQIYLATKLYYDDEKKYPGSLAFLLANTSELQEVAAPAATPSGTPVSNTNATGYLKMSEKYPICPDDDFSGTTPHSSYGDVSSDMVASIPATFGPTDEMNRFVWNYYGYKDNGTTINPTVAADETAYLTTLSNDPSKRFHYDPSLAAGAPASVDPKKVPRLMNRFAPPYTIITHCIYHRLPTADNLAGPNDLYAVPADDKNARDIILRLDGTAKPEDVALFKANNTWITQIK